MAFPNLFSSIQLGKVTVPNRTVLAPMGIGYFSASEKWPMQIMRWYEEAAIGGIGMIITGFVRVHEKLSSIRLNGIYDDRFIPSHAKLVDLIHKYNTKIFCQLGLMGGKLSSDAPSSIYSPAYWRRPRELSTGELDECVMAFIQAASRAVEAGYDGVELHGGHSYLIGEMQSPATNKRTDKYGGTFEKRMRFITDIINGIKINHSDLPIGFKYSVHEEFPDGVKIDLAKEIAQYLNPLGITYFHICGESTGVNIASKFASFPPLYVPRNTLMPLVEEIKKAVPDSIVLGGGSITVPDEAEEFIKSGKCDMVVLGRTMIADPHWPNKAKANKRVVPCIRCNECWQRLMGYPGPIWCSVNPYLGHEAEQDLPIPSKKKQVMVVGAGPAGIRCALTASKRGHDVTLCEKMPYIGGMVYPGSRPKCKEDVARLWEWFRDEISESNVKFKLNTTVTPELVEKEAPDALVVAVGAEPVIPDVPGKEKPHFVSAVEVLRDVSHYKGKNAVVIGGGSVGCETACYLADNGWKVTIVEMLSKLMEKEDIISSKIQMLMLLEEKNITVMTETKLNRVIDEGVEVILPNTKEWGLEADLVAYAVGFEQTAISSIEGNFTPWNMPGGEMGIKAPEVHVIGDCNNLGRIRTAIEDGERVGRWL